MTTEWRAIPDWEGFYEVSSYGEVRSVRRTVVDRNGRELLYQQRIMSQQTKPTGYKTAVLTRDCRQKHFRVHRLVASAFLPDPNPDQTVVRHLDSNPSNNQVANLAWGTISENVIDTVKSGRYRNGNSHKTRCPAGHPYSGRAKNGGRLCHSCRRDHERRYRKQRSEAG